MHTKRISFLSLLFALVFLSLTSRLLAATETTAPPASLIKAIIMEESRGDNHAVGDRKLKKKAYGPMQIRQDCVDDVNRVNGTNHRAEDCFGNRELSIWIFVKYMEIYATKERLGRKATSQDMARIWNGGPNGHKESATKSYWSKIKKRL